MAKKLTAKQQIKRYLPTSMVKVIDELDDATANQLIGFLRRPNVSVYPDRTTVPWGLNLSTEYGSVHLDGTLSQVDKVYINGTGFEVSNGNIEVLDTLFDGNPKDVLLPPSFAGRTRGSRGRRVRNGAENDVPFEDVQARAKEDLEAARITYENLFLELGGVFQGKNFDVSDIMSELTANKVAVKDIPQFLTEESQYKRQIVSQIYGLNYGDASIDYEFAPITADDSFIGKLMTRLGVNEAEYDEKNGVLKIGGRHITNLPNVDENGVFSNAHTRYLPYHIGYFAEEGETRVERLRVIDPVQKAIDAVALQYDMTQGDIKFKTILDVTRNLPDFDNHPYGAEILDTLKRKIVLDKSYGNTNSLLAEHQNRADELGAVALTMLDDDAKGLIDPYGTSNGSNMGVIFYLTKDATINPDGTLTKGESEHSLVGDIMNQFHVEGDNFNRHQMSFNAFLTSTDVKILNVAYSEFALWNSEDAVVLTKNGAEKLGSQTGDKVIDMHGNKSVSSIIVDPEMPADVASERKISEAVEFAKLNPHVDMVVSPISLASRLNMGVAIEGLHGQKQDLHRPDGTIVKDGVTQIAYMSLPQTAEHKSKDYGLEGSGRRYSTLFRHALSSKVGDELYRKGLVSEEVRQQHIDEIVTSFGRLGVSFEDNQALIKEGNIKRSVDSAVTVSADDYSFKTPAVIRLSLANQMENNSINIDLGDMQVISPLTNEPIRDSSGRNVLPIRVAQNEAIPYRFSDVFKQLAVGNEEGLQNAYERAISVDYSALTRKDNLLKNIDTMTFHEGAKTEMIVPDPTLKLGQVRTSVDCDRVIGHRDPCVQSGNAISFENVGGNEDNITHVQPLMINQVDGDFDSDTMGINSFDNLRLSDAEKQEFFDKSSVYEQLNRYGEVFLSTGGSHFKAGLLANDLDGSNITFADGKSNMELAHIVENLTEKIVVSPKSYGAYALSFENEQTLKDTLGRLADDGIKGDRQAMEHHFHNGYSIDEDRNVMKELITKSEWTGLAGSITNKLIAGFGDQEFDPELTRVAMDVTYSMTQSVLQMKKNADRLKEIDGKITQMKTVMNGAHSINESRQILLDVTKGLAPEEAVNKFVDLVAAKQDPELAFGTGVIHSTGASNASFAFMSESTFNRNLQKESVASDILSQEELDSILNEFDMAKAMGLE